MEGGRQYCSIWCQWEEELEVVGIGRTHISGSVVCYVYGILVLGAVQDHDFRVVRRRIRVDLGECGNFNQFCLQGMDSLIW